jgi:hypothetical protein
MPGPPVRLVVAAIAAAQLLVSRSRQPLSTREVTIVRAPRPIRLPLRVYVQDDLRDLAPVGAVRICVEHAETRDHALVGGPFDGAD